MQGGPITQFLLHLEMNFVRIITEILVAILTLSLLYFAAVAERAFIRNSMDVIESYSCIRFKLRTNERNYLQIVGNQGGCATFVGNLNNGPQILYLSIGGGIGSMTMLLEL
jgi:hypothetical protein